MDLYDLAAMSGEYIDVIQRQSRIIARLKRAVVRMRGAEREWWNQLCRIWSLPTVKEAKCKAGMAQIAAYIARRGNKEQAQKLIALMDQYSTGVNLRIAGLMRTIETADSLRAENAKLRAVVETSFREGFREGWSNGVSACHHSRDEIGANEAWQESDTRAALEVTHDQV